MAVKNEFGKPKKMDLPTLKKAISKSKKNGNTNSRYYGELMRCLKKLQ
ncbi:MAG: hypothetical protein ACOCUT_00030 [bacterium]